MRPLVCGEDGLGLVSAATDAGDTPLCATGLDGCRQLRLRRCRAFPLSTCGRACSVRSGGAAGRVGGHRASSSSVKTGVGRPRRGAAVLLHQTRNRRNLE